jgi:hypothetical protein
VSSSMAYFWLSASNSGVVGRLDVDVMTPCLSATRALDQNRKAHSSLHQHASHRFAALQREVAANVLSLNRLPDPARQQTQLF